MKRRFKVVLVPDREDGGYVVSVPALPGCLTQGDTVEGALSNAREAVELAVAVMAERGEPIPDDDAIVVEVEVAV